MPFFLLAVAGLCMRCFVAYILQHNTDYVADVVSVKQFGNNSRKIVMIKIYWRFQLCLNRIYRISK